MAEQNEYYRDLQDVASEQALRRLRTLAFEYEQTLSRLPMLKSELERLISSGEGIDHDVLANRMESTLNQAEQLLLEIDLQPLPARQDKRMDDFIHLIATTMTPRTVDVLKERYRQTNEEILADQSAMDRAREEEKILNDRIVAEGFRDNGDGTATDLHTGLVWKRCSEGQLFDGKGCKETALQMDKINVLPNGWQREWGGYAGANDWRLPTIDELCTLFRHGLPHFVAKIAPATFPYTPLEYFWATNGDLAGAISFRNGFTSFHHTGVAAVRLVRNKQQRKT